MIGHISWPMIGHDRWQQVLKNGAVCWECDKRRNKFACKAKLHVLDDQIIKETNDHTHATNRGEGARSKFFWGVSGSETGVGVTTVSNSLSFGGCVTKVLKNGDKK